MAQVLTQTQAQKMEQQLRLSQQQLQVVKLLEMPIAEFEQQVKKELIENPALEGEGDSADDNQQENGSDDYTDNGADGGTDDDFDAGEALDAISDYADDDMPVNVSSNADSQEEQRPVGDSGSFIEYLESQMVNYDLSEDDEKILQYLIGSLDNRGYVDSSLSSIVDELAFKLYIYVTEADVERVLKILQSFDPAGIGARSTQECILLQIDRILSNEEEHVSEAKRRALTIARQVIADHYDLFINGNKERIQKALHLTAVQLEAVYAVIRKLNVNPGIALSEATSSRVETQIPDFVIETDLEGRIQMSLNGGEVPQLHVSRDYVNQLKTYQKNPGKLSRGEKEGMMFVKQKIDAASMFIESIKQRRRTMYDIMKAIIKLQRAFILSKDKEDKVRLVLEDVAKESGYDVSTVSRVCKSKCALVDGRIYPLEEFFKLTRKNNAGEDIDGDLVKTALKDIVDHEDKNNPFNDSDLVEQLKKRNIDLARRTVSKYRSEMGIPSVAKRKA